uniref:sn-1-specific diacylglycerol lipase ABHD11 n=1 Tax=Glossina brevipalpis TaxID=37001 RepID=A0A1A9WGQ6_9MUSC
MPRCTVKFSNKRLISMAYDVHKTTYTNENFPPLIVMHCMLGSKANWKIVGSTLAQKCNRKIFTVDARNHGDSPHTKEHNSTLLAADILEFMRTQGYRKASVMGHGMGGRAVMYLALKYPDWVEKIVVLDVSPVGRPQDPMTMQQIFILMKGIEIPKTLTLPEGQVMMSELFSKVMDYQENVKFILRNLRKKQSGEFYWNVNVDALMENLRSYTEFRDQIMQFSPFEGSAMFVCGNRSNFVDPNTWADIQIFFPNSEVHWLDCGHLIHMHKPTELIELVIQYFNEK